MDRFWLTDEQFAKIAPHLPTDTRGKERVDDRRVLRAGGPPGQVLIDCWAVMAHRCAGGGKGGSGARPSAALAAAARPRSTRAPISSVVRSPSC